MSSGRISMDDSKRSAAYRIGQGKPYGAEEAVSNAKERDRSGAITRS